MRRGFDILMTLALMTVLLVACGNEDIDRSYTDYRTDIVTFMGNNGAGATYELVGRNDSACISLYSTTPLPDRFKLGERVLLRYGWDSQPAGQSQSIATYGVASIVSDTLRVSERQLSEYTSQMEPIKLLSLWRTGRYINLRCQVEYTTKPRHFFLLMDRATQDCDTVDCYLIHNTLGDTTYHWREVYASYHVGEVLNKPTCQVLRIHLNDKNNPKQDKHLFIK